MKVNQKGMDALHRPSFFQCADELKALTPGISIAVEFDGKGREIDNIKGATGLVSYYRKSVHHFNLKK